MSFFDFFFPEQAQASHLRTLAEQGQSQATALHRQRYQETHQRRLEASLTKSLEQRIEQLEQDLGQAGLAIEALLELLEQSKFVSREELASRIREVDARDGVVDGFTAPPPPEPFIPSRQWPDATRS